jgi:hypothetical protein
VISAVSAVDIQVGDFPGEDHQEGDSGAMDGDPPEAAASEVHPALAVGQRWAGVLEAEDFMAEASVEAPDDSLSAAPILNNE